MAAQARTKWINMRAKRKFLSSDASSGRWWKNGKMVLWWVIVHLKPIKGRQQPFLWENDGRCHLKKVIVGCGLLLIWSFNSERRSLADCGYFCLEGIMFPSYIRGTAICQFRTCRHKPSRLKCHTSCCGVMICGSAPFQGSPGLIVGVSKNHPSGDTRQGVMLPFSKTLGEIIRSWEFKASPRMPTPPRNKHLIRPYFLGG